nr:probable protein phosphatase 2C 27 [Ipomoea batatas]
MCIQDSEQVGEGMENLEISETEENSKNWASSHSPGETTTTQIQTSSLSAKRNSFPLDSICEDTAIVDGRQIIMNNFLPALRSGEWSDIGGRHDMEDTHICITDLAKSFGDGILGEEAVSFYGVFDGHGGKGASHFVRDHLPKIIVEDADFPLALEKVVTRSFMETDAAFAKSCSLDSALSSGTTALTAMIFGRSLLVANAGDCRAVLSRRGLAIEMSKDHRPCCSNERTRIESLGGFVDDGYLNGQLGVTRALGDWHIKGLKEDDNSGPLSAEPELKLITLSKEDEFLIIGSDGIWDVFRSQNAVDFARRRLQEHNNVKLCCKEIVDEAKKRGAIDNLTAVIVCFHSEPPPPIGTVPRTRVRRSISAEGLQNLRSKIKQALDVEVISSPDEIKQCFAVNFDEISIEGLEIVGIFGPLRGLDVAFAVLYNHAQDLASYLRDGDDDGSFDFESFADLLWCLPLDHISNSLTGKIKQALDVEEISSQDKIKQSFLVNFDEISIEVLEIVEINGPFRGLDVTFAVLYNHAQDLASYLRDGDGDGSVIVIHNHVLEHL